MDEFSEYEWHEFLWDEVPKMPPGPHKKIKMYAERNFPRPVVEELRAAGLSVEYAAEEGVAYQGHPDENIYQRAKKCGKVLVTMDGDFWNDRKHPVQKGPGIIFVDIPPDQPEKAIDGLARFYGLFAKYFSLDWWGEVKARVSERGFVIRMRTWEGKISEDAFRLRDNGKLFTRKVR